MRKSIYILLAVVLCACQGGREYFPKNMDKVEVEVVEATMGVEAESATDSTATVTPDSTAIGQ